MCESTVAQQSVFRAGRLCLNNILTALVKEGTENIRGLHLQFVVLEKAYDYVLFSGTMQSFATEITLLLEHYSNVELEKKICKYISRRLE